MNIYDPYPNSITIRGKQICLNLAYDRVLMALDVQDMEELLPVDRIELQCELLLADKEPIPATAAEQVEILREIFRTIFPEPEERTSKEKYIDFHQDAGMIRSAFYRIGVDLTKQHIHFMQFMELLKDLPSDTALMRTLEIRMKPVPKFDGHNQEQIDAILKAKQRVALKITEEERRAKFAESLKNSNLLKGR